VKLVLEAVCILKGVKPIRMKDAQSGQMVDSYWEASKKILQDEDFLPSLRCDGGGRRGSATVAWATCDSVSATHVASNTGRHS
jgi:hypothetical protein